MKTFTQFLKIISFLILLSISFSGWAQDDSQPACGTVTSIKNLELYKELKPVFKKYETAFTNSKSNNTKTGFISKSYIPIKAHVIRNSNGKGGIEEYELEEAINDLNNSFSGAFLEFFLCNEINYINNSTFYNFKSSDEKELVEANYTSSVINIYFTNRIVNASDEDICGYTYNKQNYDVIIIQNDCATNNSSLAHEVGHYFSLIHTHGADNTNLTKELVNGNNCSSTGDEICDTPADPKLSYKNVNNFCRYIGTEKDANGDLFEPDTENIMSYAFKGCRSHFSNQQLARMYAYYISEKNYLMCVDSSNISETNNSTDFNIYPNPILGDVVYAKAINTTEIFTYEISNLIGQVFSQGTLTSQPIHVDHLASGTYLITIKNNHSKTIKRIIK